MAIAIYSELLTGRDGSQWLSHDFGKDLLKVSFESACLSMVAQSGRVYYPIVSITERRVGSWFGQVLFGR